MCGVSIRTSEYATGNLEKAGYLSISRKANCSNRYEMSLPQATTVGTATDCDRVPQQIAGATATHCGGVPQHVAPEPLSITSEVTSYIKPLKEEAAPPSSFGNVVVAAQEERKGSGERSEQVQILISDTLARQIQSRSKWHQ
jgi:hypothetical protein